ncbi:CRISPR-associated protein, family (Cas_GSU0054) [Rubripirellula lacrimiformis]|uniref:CRISPR-associated protein, family (Cas_GSU0054) n=1 Tax=Rubripirellula lacrimiformis TaxID=1930273 RepID=A0A517NFG3_9BACT|nr:type I-U CRISPR-associated protein Csb2 [Rubripirellula lacrimiformis]QDT05857.1 CRISPR-associated protein, family (Cas_GSU0054) [Rubripirellula lacrimiformis]
MPTISMTFPGGRYHATPWGHHVNEGQIEWPPSPWRLLRALIATGYATQGWTEIPPIGRRLLESLADVLPQYEVPSASSAHSRHYMPMGKLDKNIEKTTLVFDTWANVGDGELKVRWDCDLDAEASELFTRLVESLGYVGRSESWVEASVTLDEERFDEQRTVRPHGTDYYPGPEYEQFHVMAATSPSAYEVWRQRRGEQALENLSLPDGKKKPTQSLLKKRTAALLPFPEDLIECLQKDTVWWKKQHNWSQPPGSQRVLYWRRTDALVVSKPALPRPSVARPVSAMLLAISTASRNKSALPSVIRTLPQAELFHRAIVGRVAKGNHVHCPELTGKDGDGEPLKGSHRHAHILPLDLDADGQLDHILIYASMGLGDAAQTAIRTMKRTYTKGGVGELQVSLVGRGDLESLRNLPEFLQPQIQRLLGPPDGCRSWISVTPFVAPRYVKRNGKNTLVGQVAAELASRKLPTASKIAILPPDAGLPFSSVPKLRHFKRTRQHGGTPPPSDSGFALRIELDAPIVGPLTLGYGSHFGLGLFSAVDE